VNKPGRPREVEDPVRVSVRLPGATYDRLDRQARREGVTIPEVLRRAAISVSQTKPQAQTF